MTARKRFDLPRLESVPNDDEIEALLRSELTKGSVERKVCLEEKPSQNDEEVKRAENLKRLSDPVRYFSDLAPVWRAELERLLLASGLRLNVVKALNELELRFRGITRYYREHTADFENLLEGKIFIVEKKTKRAAFYHRSHPELDNLAAVDVLAALNFPKCVVNTEVEPSKTVERKTAELPKKEPDSEENKKLGFLTKTKALWNKEIARMVGECSGKCGAFILLTHLEDDYPGIIELFFNDRKTFERLFNSAKIAIVVEESGEYFYSRQRPEVDPNALDEFQVLMGKSVRVGKKTEKCKTKRPAATISGKRTPLRTLPAAGTTRKSKVGKTNAGSRTFARFTAAPEEWLVLLEQYLQKNDLRAPIFEALERVGELLPGIEEFYLFNPKEFEELARGKGIFVHSGDEGEYFYHKDSPEFKPLSTRKASKRLDIGSQAPKPETSIEIAEDLVLKKAESFADVALLAEMTARQCDWAIERRQIMALGGNYESSVRKVDREILENAKKYGMFVWTVHIELAPERLKRLSQAYEMLGRSARTLQRILDDRELFPSTLCRLAFFITSKFQRLVKSLLIEYNVRPGGDRAQCAAAERLFLFANENYGEHVAASLKDEGAGAESFEELALEYQQVRSGCVKLTSQFDGKKKTLDRLAAIVKRVSEADRPNIYDWNALDKKVVELLRDYAVKPSSAKLREALRGVVDFIPDELDKSDELCAVVQQIELYELQRLEHSEELKETRGQTVSPELEAVRKYLGGRKIVFVGGTPQDHMRRRLSRELNAEIIWEESDHGHSLDRFGACLRDPEVAMFLVYIPWCSHKHSEELAAIVQNAGKDFVRLRKGTSPELIACSICGQVTVINE